MNAPFPADQVSRRTVDRSEVQAGDSPAPDGEALTPTGAVPAGFQFGAVTAGIKASGKPDFAVVLAQNGTQGAALFTSNRVVAAPVTVGRKHLVRSGGSVRVVRETAEALCRVSD